MAELAGALPPLSHALRYHADSPGDGCAALRSVASLSAAVSSNPDARSLRALPAPHRRAGCRCAAAHRDAAAGKRRACQGGGCIAAAARRGAAESAHRSRRAHRCACARARRAVRRRRRRAVERRRRRRRVFQHARARRRGEACRGLCSAARAARVAVRRCGRGRGGRRLLVLRQQPDGRGQQPAVSARRARRWQPGKRAAGSRCRSARPAGGLHAAARGARRRDLLPAAAERGCGPAAAAAVRCAAPLCRRSDGRPAPKRLHRAAEQSREALTSVPLR